jgi:hypothetical protein
LIAALVAIFGAEFFARCKERREIEGLRASLAGEIPLYVEPLRVDRRLFRLSHAAMAGSFSMA